MDIIGDNITSVKGWTPKKIRELRESTGWTQTKLGAWLGVGQVHVAHLESGFRPAGPQTARLLALLREKLQRGDIKPVRLKRRPKK